MSSQTQASTWTDSSRFLKSTAGTMEHCQTLIIEDNYRQHQRAAAAATATIATTIATSGKKNSTFHRNNSTGSSEVSLLRSIPSNLDCYGSGQMSPKQHTSDSNSIRFQVVVWYVGAIDMVQGRVPVTFRITIFWNDSMHPDSDEFQDDASMSQSSRSHSVWQMQGRQKAFQKEFNDLPIQAAVEVPAVSILNVVTFDTIGVPEISRLREDTKLMRWTCMYRATLIQEHWRVDNFPHDEHDISLKLAILAHRRPGEIWDKQKWHLGLATAEDSQGSTRVPHGLVVDQVSIPEFNYNRKEGLQFDFVPHGYGHGGKGTKDKCLEVKLKVLRDSSYYDTNIMPLLGLLNLVAVSITALEAQDFFQRGLLTLNIAFVEIGIRMTTDKHLPSVSYQITMQRILNEYFYGLLLLVLESLVVYVFKVRWQITWTGYIDALAALTALTHNICTQISYYNDARNMKQKVLGISSPNIPKIVVKTRTVV